MSRGNFDLEQKIFCPGEKVGMNPTLRQKKREKEKEHYKVDRYLNIPILGAGLLTAPPPQGGVPFYHSDRTENYLKVFGFFQLFLDCFLWKNQVFGEE